MLASRVKALYGRPKQPDIQVIGTVAHLGQDLAPVLPIAVQEREVVLDRPIEGAAPLGGPEAQLLGHPLELGPAAVPAALERHDGPQDRSRRGRRPVARSTAGPGSAGTCRRVPCPPPSTACRGNGAGRDSRPPCRAGPGSRRGRSRPGSSSCSPAARRPRAATRSESTVRTPRSWKNQRVQRPERMDREGQRHADDAIRPRVELRRRRYAAREQLLGPPGDVVDRLALVGRLAASRPCELRTPPAERIPPAVHGEIADLAEVVAGLAGELADAEDLLGRERRQIEVALREQPLVMLLQGEARDAEAPHQLGIRRHRRWACRPAARRPAARPGSWRRRPAARCASPIGRLPTTRLR